MVFIRASNGKTFWEKMAVESEPGLSTTQLMLTNEDLKPGKRLNPAAQDTTS